MTLTLHRLRVQLPGGEVEKAQRTKVVSQATSVVLGLDEAESDFAPDNEPVLVTETTAYRGRPKSGRQWG